MAPSRFPGYIPVGSLILQSLPPKLLEGFQPGQWQEFVRLELGIEAPAQGSATNIATRLVVPVELQDALLAQTGISNLDRIFEARWVNFEYAIQNGSDSCGLLRVYLLPDDVDRSVIDRNNSNFIKARRILLSRLDYSPSTWNGVPGPEPRLSPELRERVEDDEENLSLLEMFNTIPAPSPNSDVIEDPNHRLVVNTLLEGDVDGLKTSPYPYQRRSAAVMAMREAQPGQFLDPRLLRVKDQTDQDWYYDAPGNTIFREPRYYDGVQGGILAEQMGAGKTLICLSLILATRSLPTQAPAFRAIARPVRKKVASLADMAAACVTANGLPHRWYFDAAKTQNGFEYTHCLKAIDRNPGVYEIPAPEPRRRGRAGRYTRSPEIIPARKILLSQTSIVLAPRNLLQQWQQEISKHTTSLSVYIVPKRRAIPPPKELAQYDIVLCAHSQLETMVRKDPEGPLDNSNLTKIHFKRCIVDEGHRLGNSTISAKSDFLRGLESLHATSRWIVTGTPTRGLYGVEELSGTTQKEDTPTLEQETTSKDLEKADLDKIGAIAKLYLKARPWANTAEEGELPADWKVYVLQPKHSSRSVGNQGTLRATLNSLIIRHPLADLKQMYTDMDERTVVLDGSYQDALALNLFSMIIIFNAVQSQRTDQDYFFHPRQKKSLLLLVQNLKQASFFGGGFFQQDDIRKALETAQGFIDDEEKKFQITQEDELLLRQAMQVAHVAIDNSLKKHSSLFHEIPVFVRHFLPGAAAAAWSLDGQDGPNDTVCTDASLIVSARKLIHSALGDPTAINSLLNGALVDEGRAQITTALQDEEDSAAEQAERGVAPRPLAGNTKLEVNQSSKKVRVNAMQVDLLGGGDTPQPDAEHEIPDVLAMARLVSTASAKMTYLLDSIIEHHEEEQIIVFYENENTAFYLASMLDVIHIPHLIYAKTLNTERKAQYVHTFNNNAKFRVLLMDINQAAFGLDMKAASRIYFINPVLNPQVQAQAIGRVRRISQKKAVTVETLVLRGSIDEVIMERQATMSQAEHWKVKSILDDRPIYNYILNAGITPMPAEPTELLEQTIRLKHPQPLFRKGFVKEQHPDADLLMHDVAQLNGTLAATGNGDGDGDGDGDGNGNGVKRPFSKALATGRVRFDEARPGDASGMGEADDTTAVADADEQPARRVRFV